MKYELSKNKHTKISINTLKGKVRCIVFIQSGFKFVVGCPKYFFLPVHIKNSMRAAKRIARKTF